MFRNALGLGTRCRPRPNSQCLHKQPRALNRNGYPEHGKFRSDLGVIVNLARQIGAKFGSPGSSTIPIFYNSDPQRFARQSSTVHSLAMQIDVEAFDFHFA